MLNTALYYASGTNNLNNARANFASITISGLKPGTTGQLTMVACRDGTSSTSRQGNITINGVDVGIHDAANDVPSNQIGPLPFRADINGEVELKTVPVSASGYSYIGNVKYVFD